MARNHKITTNDFANLTEVKNITNNDWLEVIKSLEKSTKEKITKVMNHCTRLVLAISEGGNYYIIATPAYQPSLKNILTSVGIGEGNIKIMKKSTAPSQLSLEEVKKLLAK